MHHVMRDLSHACYRISYWKHCKVDSDNFDNKVRRVCRRRLQPTRSDSLNLEIQEFRSGIRAVAVLYSDYQYAFQYCGSGYIVLSANNGDTRMHPVGWAVKQPVGSQCIENHLVLERVELQPQLLKEILCHFF